jgi:uncharacterized protein YbbK (DUF523 family)/uncharacterized protein YbgA (DUF1722 family)
MSEPDADRKQLTQPSPVRIGISSCLLGQRVRYDGGHKLDRFVTDLLARFVELVPVCPEVEIGLGTPREPIHLVELAGEIRLRGVQSQADHTTAMRRYARRRVEQLAALDLCGYVLKSNSPSCGMEGVTVTVGRIDNPPDKARPVRRGRGLFADALLEGLPNLPVEEEGRFADPRLRENWIERIFAYQRLKALGVGRWKLADLAALHEAHKFSLLAHSPQAYAALSRLVASAKSERPRELREAYERQFMAALAKIATPRRHARVLEHMAGSLRAHLDAAAWQELAGPIDDYRHGLVPLVVPITLIGHHARRLDVQRLRGQTYLNPDPRELMLRNHV